MSSADLRATLLGGVDGVITSFAIVSAADVADVSLATVWVLGLSSVAADGLSMGVSEFLSSDAAGSGRAARTGLLCFASFVGNGVVPVATYAATNLGACAAFAVAQLMVLGAARTVVSGERPLWGLLQTAALGGIAGATAFGVAVAVHGA